MSNDLNPKARAELVTALTSFATQLGRMVEQAAFVKDGCVRVRDPHYLIEKLQAAAVALSVPHPWIMGKGHGKKPWTDR
jgi:hypothetical protein